MQIIRQVFVANEWVRDARNEVRAEVHSRAKIKKSLRTLKQELTKLSNKLIAADRARLSDEAGLKSVEIQAEDQCKQLHITKIELATQRQWF